MEYHLEIYRPGSCASDGCIKTFLRRAPSCPIRGGDLINTKTWEVDWPLLRVVGSRGVVRLGSPSALSSLNGPGAGLCTRSKQVRGAAGRGISAGRLDVYWLALLIFWRPVAPSLWRQIVQHLQICTNSKLDNRVIRYANAWALQTIAQFRQTAQIAIVTNSTRKVMVPAARLELLF